jgi:hypothetical protein
MDYKSHFKAADQTVLVSTGVTINVRADYMLNLAAQLAVHGRKVDGTKKDDNGAPIMIPLTPDEAARHASTVTGLVFAGLEATGDIQQLPSPF